MFIVFLTPTKAEKSEEYFQQNDGGVSRQEEENISDKLWHLAGTLSFGVVW